MLVFGGFFLILADQLLQLRLLGQSLVFMVVYVWSLKEAESRVSFFGIPMQVRVYNLSITIKEIIDSLIFFSGSLDLTSIISSWHDVYRRDTCLGPCLPSDSS